MIEATLEWLREYGYVDDADYAQQRAAAKARSGASRRGIAADLRRKGIPHELVTETVDGISEDVDADNARAFATARARKLRHLPPQVQFRRLAGALARKGYPPPVVYATVRAVLDGETSEDAAD